MKRRKLNRADGEEGRQGYWTVRLEGIEPGFHYHEYYVNGNPVLNPMAPVGYGAFKALNFLKCRKQISMNIYCLISRMAKYI